MGVLILGAISTPSANANSITSGEGPYVDKLIYHVIEGDDQQVLALQNDEIDLIGDYVDPQFYETLNQAENIEVAETPRNGYGYVTINCAKYPFNYTAFRRALAFALDKQAISNDIFDGFSVPQDSVVPQVNPFSIEGQLPYTYYESNLVLANQTLEAAGFLDVNDDDFREAPDGTVFDVIIEAAQSSSVAIEVCDEVAATLRSLGINATSVPTDFYVYLNKLYFHQDYDMAFLGESFADFDVDWLAYQYWSEYADEPYYNFPNFQNASYDSWRNQLLYSTSYDDVYEAAIEMQKIWVYQSPMIICYANTYLSAYRTDQFEGFVNDMTDGVASWWTNQKIHLKESAGGPEGGTFRWSNPLDLDTFNILTTSSKYTMNVLDELYEPLVRYNNQGYLVPFIAENYAIETSSDNPAVPAEHTRITFSIGNNASWTDGTPLTAQDVAFTFNYLRESEHPWAATYNDELYAAFAPDDYTFIIEFISESYWHLSSIADIPVLPKQQWLGIDYQTFNPTYNELITSGPFYVSEYIAGEFTELTRNDGYFLLPFGNAIVSESVENTHSSTTELPTAEMDSLGQAVQDVQTEWAKNEFSTEIDESLFRWMDTGELKPNMVVQQNMPSIIIYSAPWSDYNEIRSIVDVQWSVDLRAFRITKALAPSRTTISELSETTGVTFIDADEYLVPRRDDLSRDMSDSNLPVSATPDMAEFRTIVGSTGSTASQFTGEGVTVGHLDTGCDFGQPDLQDAYHPDSYDPTGYSLVLSNSIGNSSNLADPESWVSSGNVLTYEENGKFYLNVTGWDPVVNMQGSTRHLMGLLPPYGDGYPYGSVVGFIGYYAWAWGIDNASEFVYNEIWKDWEIPNPSIAENDFHFGWIYQQRQSPYAKIFAPVIVYKSAVDGQYHVITDWEAAEGWTAMWNGAMYYEDLDLNSTSDRNEIISIFDWNFTDDYETEVYDLSNPIVAHDFTSDGIDDLSLGALCWTMDPGFFSDEAIFQGFRSDCNAIALYFDQGTHGTATAAHVAARGQYDYFDTNNQSYFKMPGIANQSKLLSISVITSGSDIGGYLWACGFDYNDATQEFYYTGNHQANLTTNSWGWVTEPSSQFTYMSLTWEILSAPQYLDAAYPGMLHVFSAGNEGSGYMTIGPPGCASSVLSVGASTSSHYLEYYFGPEQDGMGIAGFSSRGPAFSGYPKPDVLAPGSAGYSANPFYAQYLQQYWRDGSYWPGDVKNYTIFSGTSQSAPVAAGVAALVIDTLDNESISWTPDRLKSIIQNTAEDLGYDPAIQGFGLINAEAACKFVTQATSFIVETYDSHNYMMDILEDSWETQRSSAESLTDTYIAGTDLPRNFTDGSIYFGNLTANEQNTVRQFVLTDASGTKLSDTTGWSFNAYRYQVAEKHIFYDTTYVYEDPVSNRNTSGWFNLRDELGSTAYDNAISTYSYVTIAISFADASVASSGYPWMALFDWTDSDPADGMPNLWSSGSLQGAELDLLTRAYDPSNQNLMQFATGLSNLDQYLDGDLTMVAYDPVFDSDPLSPGNAFTCSVIFWEEVPAPEFSATWDAGHDCMNWTLTVPEDDAGIYQGFVEINDGANTNRVPWSYTLVGNLTGISGEEHVIVEDYGYTLEPYDSPVFGCMEENPDDWDFRSFVIHNPHATASLIGLRLLWDDPNTSLYMNVYGKNGTSLAETTGSTTTSASLLLDVSNDGKDTYYILLHPTSIPSEQELPVNITLKAMWYESVPTPTVSNTYYSNSDPTVRTFTSGDTLTGDHVIVNVTFSQEFLPNMPEYTVSSTEVNFLTGILYENSGPLVIPSASYDPFSGMIDPNEFAWEYITGIKSGDTVDILCDFTNGDSDIMAWWYSIDGVMQDDSTWSYGNNLLAGQMSTSNKPESGQFVADFSGSEATLAVGIFDYDLASGSYDLTVDTRAGVKASSDTNSVVYDTYDFGMNVTRTVVGTAYNDLGQAFESSWTDVEINNFFSPDVEVTSPNGGEVWSGSNIILWDAQSENQDADFLHEVYVSNDGGASYMLFATGLTLTTYDWDVSSWADLDTYKVKIVTHDRGMVGWDESDGTFSAGDISGIDYSPIIQGYTELSFAVGDLAASVKWRCIDHNPQEIAVWRNNTPVVSDPWTSSVQMKSIDCSSLNEAIYNFTIVATDQNGHQSSMTTFVTIFGPGPEIEATDDLTYLYGTVGHELTWTATDSAPSHYLVYRNGTIVESGVWDGSSVTVSVDGLGIGTYNYTLWLNDTAGYSSSSSAFVIVEFDEVPPTINSPEDISFMFGELGYTIQWSPADEYPDRYEVYVDSILQRSGDWNSSSEVITVSLDDLGIGIHNYTVAAYDLGNNFVTDTVIVNVTTDSDIPELSAPADFEYSEGYTGNSISWTVNDENPGTYTVYRNGTEIGSGEWSTTPATVIINVDGLSIGLYNFTIQAEDDFGNIAFDTVLVTVIDTIKPTISSPPDLSYYVGATGNTITWNAEDNNLEAYAIYRNGSLVEDGSLSSDSESISISVDGLDSGTYNYTIVVVDVGENTISDTVMVEVLPAADTTTDTETTTGTTTAPGDFDPLIVGIIITVGASVVIVIFILLIIRHRRQG